jgi:hypothetical protein
MSLKMSGMWSGIRISIVVMQDDENIFVLNLPILEQLFSFSVDESCLDPYQYGENIKGCLKFGGRS